MTREIAFIAVGSNIQPLIHIPRALDLLQQVECVRASSTFYQTEPLGPPGQPTFVNGIWCVETATSPHRIKADILTGIERQLGRVHTDDKYAPRHIDLDLILYGRRRCDDTDMALPHPDLARPFVLGPLWELIEALGLGPQFCELLTASPSIEAIGYPLPQLTRQLRACVQNPSLKIDEENSMSKPALRDRLRQGPLLLDGGMGSELIERGATPTRGNDALNLEAPDVILAIQRDYVAAGSQAILTNTFGANAVSLKRHGLADQTAAINQAAVRIARQAIGEQGYVLGDIGPCGEFLEPLGLLKPVVLQEAFAAQARGLAHGQVDGFIIETMTALEEIEVAVQAVRSVVPDAVILTSMAFDCNPNGFRTMMGIAPEQAVQFLSQLQVDAVGFNCGSATLDEYVDLTELIATALQSIPADITILAEPNAGKPVMEQGEVIYKITPDEFGQALQHMAKAGASLLGGCCGTTPEFIRAAANTLNK